MKHQLPLLLFVSFLTLTLTPNLVGAQANLNARFALHAKDHFTATKAIPNLCPDPADPSVPNYSPNYDGLSCWDYSVVRPTNEFPGPHVYLVVGQADPSGISGASCGITYTVGGSTGISETFTTFTSCTDGLEFRNSGAYGEFPAPEGGLRLTWVSCQDYMLLFGVHAVMGVFYVYAYSEDLFKVIPNNNLGSGPEMAVTSCTGGTTDLLEVTAPPWHPFLGGAVHFGGDGSQGFTPCIIDPVQPTTWGMLKHRYRNDRSQKR